MHGFRWIVAGSLDPAIRVDFWLAVGGFVRIYFKILPGCGPEAISVRFSFLIVIDLLVLSWSQPVWLPRFRGPVEIRWETRPYGHLCSSQFYILKILVWGI